MTGHHLIARATTWLTGTSPQFEARCLWVAWDTMDQVARQRGQQARLRAADELGVGREYRELLTMWGRRV